MKMNAVVVGGGISGLTVAYKLRQNNDRRITLLEAGDRFGGVIRTLRNDGFFMEAGADAFDGSEPAMTNLCRDLGLSNDLVECGSTLSHVSILAPFQDRVLEVPPRPGLGRGKIIPVDFSFSEPFKFLTNSILSFGSRLRILLEPFVPAGKKEPDESIASFMRRRFGRGLLEELARPLVRGVLMAEPGDLGLREYFPHWQRMEFEHGSIAGAVLARKGRYDRARPFYAMRGGLDRITSALLSRLDGVALKPGAGVEAVVRRGKKWEVVLKNRDRIEADAVCLALSAGCASGLLSETAPSLSSLLSKIRYDSIAVVNMIFRREDVPGMFSRPGFTVPAAAGRCPFASLKTIGTVEDGGFVRLRAFISQVLQPEVFAANDAVIGRKVLEFMTGILGFLAQPSFISVERYSQALAQYGPGHTRMVSAIEEALKLFPGLFLAGNGYHGFGISDCVREALKTGCRMGAGT